MKALLLVTASLCSTACETAGPRVTYKSDTFNSGIVDKTASARSLRVLHVRDLAATAPAQESTVLYEGQGL
jgi:hypothetical protein